MYTKVCLAYNLSVHASTGYTLQNILTEAYVLARRKGITEHNRQKALYNVKVHGAPYQVGD